MQSAFDPKAFLDVVVTEQGSTVVTPVPPGEHIAIIEKVDTRAWQAKDGSSSGIALDVTYNIDSPAVKEALGRSKVTVTQGIMLDLTDGGALDMGKGKNVTLNRLREAVDLNVAGKPFSFRMLEGKVVKINVQHRPDGDRIYNDVKGVVRAA
jgi:hypothetical protein